MTRKRSIRQAEPKIRRSSVESLEPRVLFNTDPIWVGAVYVEDDSGSDVHGDSFYISFNGGAAGTKLNRLEINLDQNAPGISIGDNIFDTVEGGLGVDHAAPFRVESLKTRDPNARVIAQVEDGSMKMVLLFENFYSGDSLKFSIDVDEVQHLRGGTDVASINNGLDAITSGEEFDGSTLKASFTSPHFEDVETNGMFANDYDPMVAPSKLDLPADNAGGFRDRSAGVAATVVQTPKPISLAGTVYADNNRNLTQDNGESGIQGVTLELYRLNGSTYVSTGIRVTTDSQGHYRFGPDLKIPPGTFQIRETQPSNFFSVGAIPGVLDGQSTLGKTVAGDKDQLTAIEIPLGDTRGTGLDFAEAQPVQISGFVYRDNNNNGSRESGELGIPNVDIQIVSLETITDVAISQTVRTGADGSYRFVALPPGRYRISETSQPAAYLDGKDTPGTVNGQARGTNVINDQITEIRLNGNDNGIEFNFGEIEPSSLSGHVCVAMPGFDCFSTEPNSIRPLPGVRLDLVDGSGSIIATTTSGTDGRYQFDRLPSGTYRIIETQPADWIDGLSRAGQIGGASIGNAISGTRIEQIVLGGGQQGINYDFCELPPASLSGHVYRDDNNDGVRQSTELPLPGASLALLDADGTTVAQTRTDSLGQYKFSLLRPGNYRIVEVTPAGYLDGKDAVGTIAGKTVGVLSNPDTIASIRLPSGMDGVNYDFGELLPGSIAGNVYEDQNGDCVRDPNEPPLSGVLIELLDARGIVVASTITDADGNYRFEQLATGTYAVRERQPTGYLQGGQMAGSAGGDDHLTDLISSIALASGVDAIDYNFCEQRVSSLEGFVFADLNRDCIFDSNESPIANVPIELWDAAGKVIRATTTDSLGHYRFANLVPGSYTIHELQPDGYFQGGQMAPRGVGNTKSVDLISSIALASGQSIDHLDFCEIPPATISGYVFQDGSPLETSDGLPPKVLKGIRDGVRNEGDQPIANVTLELRLLNGQRYPSNRALPGIYSGDTIRVTTDSRGYYEFRGLRPGTYNVYEVQPNGYFDGRDTAGDIGGFAINPDDVIDELSVQSLITTLALDTTTNPRNDAIVLVDLNAGDRSIENNFSEVVVKKPNPPAPPPPSPPQIYSPPPGPGSVPAPVERMLILALPETHATDVPAAGYAVEYTWHLSIIDAGEPRGNQVAKRVSRDRVARTAQLLNASQWTIDTLNRGRWIIVSASNNKGVQLSRDAFDIVGATQLSGDFNGDGRDDIALFKDGEWLLDINGNGRWDEDDLWAKLGSKGDLPVVGDWDGDGKDDIGIFGLEWAGDDEAIDHEPGLPDPDNRHVSIPKNIPPRSDDRLERERLMQRSAQGVPRSDVIDHVFRFGSEQSQPIAGDFNGDGISTTGVFADGKWQIDLDGDGKLDRDRDAFYEFGQTGDIAVVGDFNKDGRDEIGVVRGNDLIIDSNRNGKLDATDQVIRMQGESGRVIVGDFDGDGYDEAAFYSVKKESTPDTREARKAG